MAPIIAGIIAVAKAIPVIAGIISTLSAMREKSIEKKVLSRYKQKERVKRTLRKQLVEENDPAKRKELIKHLELIDPYTESV